MKHSTERNNIGVKYSEDLVCFLSDFNTFISSITATKSYFGKTDSKCKTTD